MAESLVRDSSIEVAIYALPCFQERIDEFLAVLMKQLVLASTSKYREALLRRLRIPFETCAPGVDETLQPGETAAGLVERLSVAKAQAQASFWPGAWLIGSDQTAVAGDRLLGKPEGFEAAYAQLKHCSGQAVEFHTGLCLLDADTEQYQFEDIMTTVHFRHISQAEIKRYIDLEQPFECAGSFRSEGLGIVLFERILSEDPTALLGLPLIALCRMLRRADNSLIEKAGSLSGD